MVGKRMRERAWELRCLRDENGGKKGKRSMRDVRERGEEGGEEEEEGMGECVLSKALGPVQEN